MFTTDIVEPDADASPEKEVVEPVAAEAEPEEQPTEPESEVESSPAVEDNDEEKTRSSFEERIDKLTQNWRETERAMTVLEQENEGLRKKLLEIPEKVEPFKTLADFDYDESKYQSYLGPEIDRRATAAAERVAKGFQSKNSAEARQQDFRAREKEYSKTVKDYHEVVYGTTDGQRNWAASDVMVAELQAMESGEEVAYYLAKHPEEALSMYKAPDRIAIGRMAVLAATLKSEKGKAKVKSATKAPPPPLKIEGSDPGLEKGYRESMTDAEFAKKRRKEIAQRGS